MGSRDVGGLVADAPAILRRVDRRVLVAFVDALDATLVDGDLANAIEFGLAELVRRASAWPPRVMSDYHQGKIAAYLGWSGRDPDVDAAIVAMLRILDVDVVACQDDSRDVVTPEEMR